MVEARERVELNGGHAEWDRDPAAWVRIGDRAIPFRIDVTLPNSPDRWPALSMTIEARNGVPQCVGLSLTAHPEGREIRLADLRAIKLESWVDDVAALAAMDAATAADGSITLRSSGARKLRIGGGEMSATEFARAMRPGHSEEEFRETKSAITAARTRRTITDDLLKQVSDVYRDHIADRPVEAVRSAFGTTQSTAARWVVMARRAGFLPPTTPGKARG